MGTLKVGDTVVYDRGLRNEDARNEVGVVKRINDFYGGLFISMDLLIPKKVYHSPTTQTTMTGITAPIKYFKLLTQEWEV
jgi:hypothetical protein